MRSGQHGSELVLSFDPLALERCYLVADILHDAFAEPFAEYGLIGLADQTEPFHVVATPLLVGQSVTAASVEQPGRQVLRMRGEMERIAHRMQRTLVPIAFIHRHPSSCEASTTDEVFLRGVFVDQVSTVVSFEEIGPVDALDPSCPCPDVQRVLRDLPPDGSGSGEIRSEYAIAFSLIVNRHRDHRIYAVRKAICSFCEQSVLGEVPARIVPDSRFPASDSDREALKGPLVREIQEKISFDRERSGVEEVR